MDADDRFCQNVPSSLMMLVWMSNEGFSPTTSPFSLMMLAWMLKEGFSPNVTIFISDVATRHLLSLRGDKTLVAVLVKGSHLVLYI